MIFKQQEYPTAGQERASHLTVYSAEGEARNIRVTYLKVTLVGLTVEAETSVKPGDLIVCSPPFTNGLSIEGLYEIVHCRRAEANGRWVIAMNMLALQPTETLIRWYFQGNAHLLRSGVLGKAS